jgi:hypothetical protein
MAAGAMFEIESMFRAELLLLSNIVLWVKVICCWGYFGVFAGAM